MAKQPESYDRFRLSFEIEAEALGQMLSMLNRIGITDAKYDIITDVLRYKNNQRRRGAVTGKAALLAVFQDGKEHTTTELRGVYDKLGLAPASLAPMLHVMKDKDKTIRRVAEGTYQLAKTPAAKAAAAAALNGNGQVKDGEHAPAPH